jgi:hypothetical protein
MTPPRIIACVLACSLATSGVGCTSMKTIPPVTSPAAPAFGRVEAGDLVIVETRDGRRVQFVVQQVEGDAIVSPEGVRYTRDEIAKLQRRSFSGPKTALALGGAFLALYVVLAAAAVAVLGGW